MTRTRPGPVGSVGHRLIVLATAVGLVATACGGSATPTPSASVAPPASAAAPSSSAAPATASPAPSDAGYTGPATTITYSIWGDPTEQKSQQAIVDAFHAANPKITVKVTVADWDTYWDKLQTSIAGGDAPDVFAMDGPLFPDYQSRDVLLNLKPYIDKSGYDLTQLADQAVADFTTTDGGQYGLPRDLNVIALFYNKKMFDAAGLPYPDDTWDWAKLVDVGTKLTLKTSDGKVKQWGFYTETSDMENYWSSLVWQNGGEVISADHKTSLVGSDQAIGGMQFLQDLIYKDKIMDIPNPDKGDEFEQGQAALEADGSWLVATHLAAGIDFGIAPLPTGPAGRFTSVNPTGAVVFKGTKNPDAAWEFVKYLASPAAQTKTMELKSSMPANKAVLTGPFAISFPGADVLANALSYAHLKPSFKGYNDWTTALQTELDTNVYNADNKTVRQAIDSALLAKLDAILASQ